MIALVIFMGVGMCVGIAGALAVRYLRMWGQRRSRRELPDDEFEEVLPPRPVHDKKETA